MALCKTCGVDHAPGIPSCPETRVGQVYAERYRITRVLGVGGMGTVFEAEHLRLRRLVALKIMHPEYAAKQPLRQRFFREARAVAALKHPSIIGVNDVDEAADRTLFLEMEMLRGESLEGRIRRAGPVPSLELAQLCVPLLDALAKAHAAGIVHRDLKPANIFLAYDDRGEVRPVLLDFGIARAPDGEVITRTGDMIGTPVFMSPEQFEDPRAADARSDVYSFGATMFCALTGQPPVQGDSVIAVFTQLRLGQAQLHPRHLRPDVPEWLDRAIAQAMAGTPGARQQSAGELKAALEEGILLGARSPGSQVPPAGERGQRPPAVAVSSIASMPTVVGGADTTISAPPDFSELITQITPSHLAETVISSPRATPNPSQRLNWLLLFGAITAAGILAAIWMLR